VYKVCTPAWEIHGELYVFGHFSDAVLTVIKHWSTWKIVHWNFFSRQSGFFGYRYDRL